MGKNKLKPLQMYHLVYLNVQTSPPIKDTTCNDLRGTHTTLKVSESLLWGEKVIVLVFEIIQF